MSHHVIQSYNERKETNNQSLHSSQSVWMAHWCRTSYNLAAPSQNHIRDDYRGKAKQIPFFSGPDTAKDISKCGKAFTEVPVAGTANITDESVTMISKYSRNERLASQLFPMFSRVSQSRDGMLTIKNDQATIFYGQAMACPLHPNVGLDNASLVREEKMLVWTPSEAETVSRECNPKLRGTSPDVEQLKSHNFVQKKSMVVSASFQGGVLESSSKYVPSGSNTRERSVAPSRDWLERFNGSSSGLRTKGHPKNNKRLTELDSDHLNFHSGSALFANQKMSDRKLQTCASETALVLKNGTDLVMDGPSTSKNQLTVFVGNQHQRSINHLDSKFPIQSYSSEVHRSENVSDEYPCDNRHFHQTKNQVLITKTPDLDPYEGGQILRETISTQCRGNRTRGFLSLPSNLAFQGQKGVKLQPLWSSTDSEESGRTADSSNSASGKNEASAETDTMDMDDLDGEGSSPSNKETAVFPKPVVSQAADNCTREFRGIDGDTKLPCHSTSSSMDEMEPTTSRTQSLDVERLLSHAGRISESKSKSGFSIHSGPGPECRWVKRLKTSASDSLAHQGTKSSRMEELEATSAREKLHGFFGKLMKRSMACTEPSINKSRGKEPLQFLDQPGSFKDRSSSSTESMGRGWDELLSHSWIRRWCRNGVAPMQKKPGKIVLCEPHSLKATCNDLQTKQYPSVGAMALMGKALNGFLPCEIKKRGSLAVWNARGF